MNSVMILNMVQNTGKRFSEKSLTWDYKISYEKAKEVIMIGLVTKRIYGFKVVDCPSCNNSHEKFLADETDSGKILEVAIQCLKCKNDFNSKDADVYTYYKFVTDSKAKS